jgi:hypothetical protein
MATRLDSGNIQLRQVNAAPMQQIVPRGVDYVGPRAEAQANQTLAQVIDRMGQFANTVIRDIRVDQAMKYTAQNPITPEQIEAAKNGDTSQIIPQGNFSYFDQAVRKARSFELSNAFEMEGRQQLAQMLTQIESGQPVTAEQISSKITSLTDGYTKSLANIDGEAALKFRASMATYGNSVLSHALTLESKKAKEQGLVKLRSDYENQRKIFETAVLTQPETAGGVESVLRKNILDQAALQGPVVFNQYVNEIDKDLRDAKINAVTKAILEDDTLMSNPQIYKRIQTGNVGRYGAVVGSLDQDAIAKINANIFTAQNQRKAMETEARADAKRQDMVEMTNLLTRALPLPENSKERKRLAGQIAEIANRNPDAVPIGVLKDLLEPPKTGDGSGNQQIEFNLRTMIKRNQITSEEQIWSYVGPGRLSGKQANELLQYLQRSDKGDSDKLDQGYNRRAGIPVEKNGMAIIDPKGAEFKRKQELKAQGAEITARYLREGKPEPTAQQILDEIDESISKQMKSTAVEAARKSLDVYRKKAGLPEGTTINRSNLSALEQKGKLNANELTQAKRLLDQIEGR